MRIGIDIRLIGKKRTGDEVVFFNLVKNLAKLDSENEYSLLTDITEQETLSEIAKRLGAEDKKNFKIIPLETPNRFVWNFWTLPQYLRKNPVDIYQTQYITPFFVSKKIKIVTIVHDISFNFFPQFIKFSDLFFLKILIPLSLKRADRVVAVSEFTKNEIVDFYGIPAEKVVCVYNAVSEEFLENEIASEKLEAVREKYALPEKFILYMGTLQPRKNISQLVEAFVRVKEKLGNTKLVICGNRKAHNYDKRIDDAVDKNQITNEVIFTGFIDEEDKKVVFHLAHAFVFPSLYEGFGIPMLEAMSQKVPVLASDIASLKEVASESALFFGALDLDDFAQKVYTICEDIELRERLIQKGIQRISFFDWKKSAQETMVLYEKLFDNK